MTTIINNPSGGGDSGLGMIIGALIVVAAIVLFVVYGLPAIRNSKGTPGTPGTPGTQIPIQTP